MPQIGKIRPSFNNGEECIKWEVPVEVYNEKTGKQLKVTAIYEDEGVLCIDVVEVNDG